MDTIKTGPKPPIDDDLSREIIAAVPKNALDIVRCTRVNGTFYRCNWWSPGDAKGYDNPAMSVGQVGTTHVIRKSQFLDVKRTPQGLVIEVIGGQ